MTKNEFQGQFIRLCRGFKYDATDEQTEAWFRRIGHIGVEPWAESVTNLLCASHFPRDLDRVLQEVEKQAQACRAKAILRDRPVADRVHARLGTAESGIGPNLFQAIKCFAGHDQVRKYLTLLAKNEDMDPQRKQREFDRLTIEEARLTKEIMTVLPVLEPGDIIRLLDKYESEPVRA
jgi:hypothetical protein